MRKLAPVFDDIHRMRDLGLLDLGEKSSSKSETSIVTFVHEKAETQVPSEESVHEEIEANGAVNEEGMLPRMRDFVRPIIGEKTSCIVLGDADNVEPIYFNLLPFF